MGRDIHVTSNAISKAGTKLSSEIAPLVQKSKSGVDQTNVDAPAFGLIGLGIQAGHSQMQTYAREYFQAASDCLRRMDNKLQEIAKTWRTAEDKSTTKVQG